MLGQFREAAQDGRAESRRSQGRQADRAQLKPDFSVNLPPIIGDDLDKELRAQTRRHQAQHTGDNIGLVLMLYSCRRCCWRASSTS